MKFVFFGSPEFASIILEKLIAAGFVPEAVVCNPDRPVGRKKVITPPPTKVLAKKHNIPVFQPETLENFKLQILNYKFDFFVVAAYAKILPKDIVEIPKLGTIGVHPSLLPKYRGASPIQSAILAGEKETGVTLYLLDEKMDRGEIVSSIKYQVSSDDTYKTSEKKLAELGGSLLAETLPKFLAGEITPKPQNESEATYTKKFSTEDAFIEEKELESALSGTNPEIACSIYRKILALTPEPGVWTYANTLTNGHIRISDGTKRVKLLEAELQNGKLILKVIQTEGQKPIKVR
ncbi:MAG: methionyl-tRNA formyltransferase [Candidatus Liptonbacteria bacterium]|nr:methionyl-tRNA formyltransferase [Candidatus Liptonbacteria bacterium]